MVANRMAIQYMVGHCDLGFRRIRSEFAKIDPRFEFASASVLKGHDVVMVPQSFLAVEDSQSGQMQSETKFRIFVSARSATSPMLSKAAARQQEVALGRDVTGPESIIWQIGLLPKANEAKRVPLAKKDGLIQFGRLKNSAEHRHFPIRIF